MTQTIRTTSKPIYQNRKDPRGRPKGNKKKKIRMSYLIGDFSFVKDPMLRKAIEHDYTVVCKLDLWSYFEHYNSGTTFLLLFKLNNVQWYDGHSGASWSLSMTNMRIIAKYGWNNLVQRHLRENRSC